MYLVPGGVLSPGGCGPGGCVVLGQCGLGGVVRGCGLGGVTPQFFLELFFYFFILFF